MKKIFGTMVVTGLLSSASVSSAFAAAVNGGAPVPEPTALLLFGAGLTGLAGWVRRKKR